MSTEERLEAVVTEARDAAILLDSILSSAGVSVSAAYLAISMLDTMNRKAKPELWKEIQLQIAGSEGGLQ